MVHISEKPTLGYEQRLWKGDVAHIAGVDEAGRGALAGPVVAAAVVFPAMKRIPSMLRLVNDSKKLTAAKREKLYGVIIASCAAWGVGIVSHEVIDRVNIANASLEAMRKAVAKLPVVPGHVLLDGYFPPARILRAFGNGACCTCIAHGDEKIFSIAAASIIAKVTRDRLMRELGAKFADYGFGMHKGYGTPRHYHALRLNGPCAIHRRTFYLGI